MPVKASRGKQAQRNHVSSIILNTGYEVASPQIYYVFMPPPTGEFVAEKLNLPFPGMLP